MQLELDKIRTDGGTQPRGQIDWGVVAEYVMEMRDNGAVFPAIVVFYDGAEYWLADGYHRFYATEQSGRDTIDADVRQGTVEDARWFSYAANKSHGLRRSNEDKRRAVEAALQHPKAGGLSNVEIARHCGVSEGFVRKLKPIFVQYEDEGTKTVTRNGTTYEMSTANIGKVSEPGISPVTFSADGREASVTVTNMDVAGGLAAVMEAEPPAKRDLGYALYPCHMCDEKKIRIDAAGDSVRCEACGQAWGSLREYHTGREAAKRRQDLNEMLTCYRCGSKSFVPTDGGDGFSCFKCGGTWTSIASYERHRAAHEAPAETRHCMYCNNAQDIEALDLLEKTDVVCKKCKRLHNFWKEPIAMVVEADGSLVPNSLAVHHSSKSAEHYTPPEIVDAVIEVMGAITLDPCSNSKAQPAVRAAIHFTLEDDGLSKEWFGNVYMNPPYGREIGDWVTKLTTEHDTGKVREAIALVPARPDTQWWKQLRDYPVCFVEGRLQFVGNDDPAPFPSAIFYLGTEIGRFYRVFSQYGDVWQRIEPGMFGE